MNNENFSPNLARRAGGRRFPSLPAASIAFLLVAAYIAFAVSPWPAATSRQTAAHSGPVRALPAGNAPAASTPPHAPKRTPSPSQAPAPQQDILAVLARHQPGENTIANEYLIRFQRLADLRAFLQQAPQHGLRVLDTSEALRIVRFHAKDITQARAFLNSIAAVDLRQNVAVETPDAPSPLLLAAPFSYRPFGSRALAWLGLNGERRPQGEGATVAVLDTGVLPHPALDPQRIVQIDLLPPEKGADSNGPLAGHGTAVAALIAGNGEGGVTGVAPEAGILAIRVLDAYGQGDGFTVAKGVVAAVDNGAEIINLSLGSYGISSALAAAVEYALARGVVVVAAAGNDGRDEVMFPASHPGVVGVAAVDALSQHLNFSNSGPGVDIAAPGFEVTTAWSDNTTVAFSGTSAAAPFVAGTIAALLSANPGLTPAEAARLALAYANDAGPPGADHQFGRGILNWQRIADRQTPGIYDLAVADYYLPA
ncbi:MAG TPA: hypothetical protein ENJ73_00945, partial [Desulfobacterales bacterium]|nr:hypothetical protein [Desulfobacterales bacterium]